MAASEDPPKPTDGADPRAPDAPADVDATTAPDATDGDATDGDATAAAPPRRALEFLRRTEDELDAIEAELAPEERAELATWFARPSRETAEEQARNRDEDEILDEQAQARQVKIDLASAAIEPWMIHLLERHKISTARMVRVIEAPPAIIDESILRLKPVSLDEIAGARDFQRPSDIDDAVSENVPQAVLRDLYRAETDFPLRLESPFDEPIPEDPRIELRAAVRERRLMPVWPSTYQTAMTARRTFRELIAGSWPDKVAAVKAAQES